MNLDVSTYKDENGNTLMYAAPSNLSPASEEYEALVKARVEKLREANPDMDETAIPVDLVTCSADLTRIFHLPPLSIRLQESQKQTI